MNLTANCSRSLKISTLALLTVLSIHQAGAQKPFELGVEQKGEYQPPPASSSGYYAPKMIQPAYVPPPQQRAPMQGNANSNRMQGNVQQERPPQQRQVLQGGAVALPPAFMGAWLVQGQRTKIEAVSPIFQQGAEQGFAPTTRNMWNINGNPQQGYTMSNDQGVQTQLKIVKVAGQQAVIFYQHQIGKAMAQEQIIMQLQNGGASFSGLERIAIVKDGQKRATVSYGLSGQRQ
jgi:hypothetical protein